MNKSRKRYSPSEKAKIVIDDLQGRLTASEIASKYSIHPTQVSKWKKQALAHIPEAFSNKKESIQKDYESQLSLVYEQIGRLKMENEFLKKSVICLPEDRRVLLEPEHPHLSLRRQCELLGVSRSSCYYAKQTPATLEDNKFQLLRLVDEVYTRHPFFGTRKMADYLQLNGHEEIERHHTRWAYGYLGLRSVAPGPHTSQPHPEHKIYPYLLRGLEIKAPNHVWSTDITYIRMRKGFVYLMAIIDWYSRYVLDWELSNTLEADFCIETLERLLERNRCDIFNTDQGSQFTSKGFTGVLKSHKIKISMDGKGRALDNIFIERLWRSVKYECVYLREWSAPKEAKSDLKSYFAFYNEERPHQSLAGRTPAMVYH